MEWVLTHSDWSPFRKRKFGRSKKNQGRVCPEERPDMGTPRRCPTANQGERLQKKPIPPTP